MLGYGLGLWFFCLMSTSLLLLQTLDESCKAVDMIGLRASNHLKPLATTTGQRPLTLFDHHWLHGGMEVSGILWCMMSSTRHIPSLSLADLPWKMRLDQEGISRQTLSKQLRSFGSLPPHLVDSSSVLSEQIELVVPGLDWYHFPNLHNCYGFECDKLHFASRFHISLAIAVVP